MLHRLQSRPFLPCVALLLLVCVMAVMASPLVDLPNCANRARLAAAMFYWLVAAIVALGLVATSRLLRGEFWASLEAFSTSGSLLALQCARLC